MARPDTIEDHLVHGRERARAWAGATMAEVRKAVGVGRQ
jgi:hypothetical protein